jgi:trimeric autotransporter adhesin
MKRLTTMKQLAETGLALSVILSYYPIRRMALHLGCFIVFFLFMHASYGQSPEKFNYQAVIRDASGNAIVGKTISLRLSILKGGVFGTYSYVETHKPQTSAHGVVNLVVGEGTVSTGTLVDVKWDEGPYFLKVELDVTGGTSFSEMGTTQLLSVPYALHSKTASNALSADYNKLINKPDLTLYQSISATTNWDKNQSDDVTLNGNQTITGIKSFADTLYASKAINATGNSGTTPVIYAENQSTTGNAIALRAITKSSNGYAIHATSPYIGISASATDVANGQYGVYGACMGAGGFGVYGYAQHATSESVGVMGNSLSSNGYGVYGRNGASTGIGVYGKTTWTSGENIGVKGECNSPAGYAIYGINNATTSTAYAIYGETKSPTGRAIMGESNATTGYASGVYGLSRSNNGVGVFGTNPSTTGSTRGVYGSATSNAGIGVYGVAEHETGVVHGVYGLTSSTSGKGVAGFSQAETGNSMGVFGSTSSSSGVGVYGLATSNTGVNYGVKGYSTSSTGFDFYAFGAGTNYGSSSSIRWKKEIQPIANTLEKLKNLRGVYFTWDEEHGGQHDLGFIGEEVAKYFPELVVNDPEAPGYIIGMDYSKMTPVLLQAINEQQNLIEAQNAQIQELVKRIEALEKK